MVTVSGPHDKIERTAFDTRIGLHSYVYVRVKSNVPVKIVTCFIIKRLHFSQNMTPFLNEHGS